MTFEQLCVLDDRLLAIWQEAQKKCYRNDPKFCREELWYATPKDRGYVGLKFLMMQCFPGPASTACENAYDICYQTIRNAMPPCNHPESEGCRHDFEVPPAGPNSLKRNQATGFGGIVAQLQAAAEGRLVPNNKPLYADGRNPEVQAVVPGAVEVRPFNDANEPVFIVRNEDAAYHLGLVQQLRDRSKAGELSPWYLRNAFYTCDDAARKTLLTTTKAEFTGALSWKPVVLTFKDEELEEKLSAACPQVVTVEPDREGLITQEAVRKAIKTVVATSAIGIPDMPAEVLDGWLGEICRTRMAEFPRAYAWPALLSAASVLVPVNPRIRTNLYVALVGDKGTGKSSAYDYAFQLLGLQSPPLLKLKSGSAEGLIKKIGDVDGAPRLFFTDELEHLLLKAAIEGATFPSFLSTAYYEDAQQVTMAKQQEVTFNCRLSMAGGIVTEKFQDLFGAATTGGFYDRFIFSMCPTGVSYAWRPFDGFPIFEDPLDDTHELVKVDVADDVWAAVKSIAAELNTENRVVEHAIRAAVICASFDGRTVLRAADLKHARAFAEYQARMRKMLAPNPGKNPEAIIAYKVKEYLQAHAPNGEWVNRREMLRNTRAMDYGLSTVDRAMNAMEFNRIIEQGKAGRQKVIRMVE